MYCSQCGKELREGSRFCPFCGNPVPMEQVDLSKRGEGRGPTDLPEQPAGTVDPGENSFETANDKTGKQRRSDANDAAQKRTLEKSQTREKSQTGSRKKLILGTVVVLMIAALGIGGYFGVREYQYRSTLAAVDSAFADRDYEEAVTLLEDLIQIRPEEANNYLTLARANLELENLYGAKQALVNGYAATGDESLQNVSLWGPISAFEIAIWASESMPFTRQEYYFGQQDFVQGYVGIYGGIEFVMNYYFDSVGNVAHVAVLDYSTNILGLDGVNRTLWETGWPFPGAPNIGFDYNYDAAGNVVSAEMDGEIITISKTTETNVVLESGDELITVRYDTVGRPIQILFDNGKSFDLIYQEDESCVVEYTDDDCWLEFNKDGLFTALVGDDADAFELKLDSQNRVESVEMEDSSYRYYYSETGYLERAAICNGDGDEIFYETLDYDDSGNLIQITQYPDQEHISYHQLEYNEDGRLAMVTSTNRDQKVSQDVTYEYKQNGQLDYYVLRYPSEETEDMIMVFVPVYDKYGVIEQYTSGQAVYNPGTYTGSADGFGGEVSVEVTVNYMQITNVEVINQNETVGIGPEAFETLISEMLDTGSPDVDSVTGATISSQAFLDAVDNALSEARLYQEYSQTSAETVYTELDGKTFTLASGVGNWHTEITFDEGGLFQGTYYDLDMGDTSAEYPNGTCYLAGFNGTMGNVEQIDEYTYSMEIVDLFLDVIVNGEEIRDGVRYVEATYDIEYGDAFELYYPGRRTSDLPEEFMNWLRMPLAWAEDPEVLPVYGLYSLRNRDGFFCSNG